MSNERTDFGLDLKAIDVQQRIIEGYATTPDEDLGGDIVEAGACKFSSLSEVDAYVGHDHRFGALPVGTPLDIHYQGSRLYTKTRIHPTRAGDDLLAVAAERQAAGNPLGLSIGYPPSSVVAKYETKADGRMVRRILSLQLKEYSFTAMPMNAHARVIAVKSSEDLHVDAGTLEVQRILMRHNLAEAKRWLREMEERG